MIRAAVVALFTCLLAAPATRAADELSLDETQALVDAARERLTANYEESEPFRIRAKLRFPFDANAPDGALSHAVAGPKRLRTEWAFPGWQQLELRDGHLSWVWLGPENDERMEALSLQIRTVLRPAHLLSPPITGPGKRLADPGRELAQVSLGIDSERAHQVWIDTATAELVASVRGKHRYDFGGERKAGGRSWPRSIRVSLDGDALLSASFGKPEIGSAAVPDSLFVPPEGLPPRVLQGTPGLTQRMREGTPGLSPPVLLEQTQPHYPETAKRQEFGGTVVIRAIIGVDGTVSEVQLLSGVRRDLDEAALDAVRRRVYSPGLLDGQPVEVISTIRITFTLKDSRSKPGQRRRLQGEPR
jgi:TonB family protein